MERERLGLVVLVLGIALFGAALATRSVLNPWWTNAGVAALIFVGALVVLRRHLASLLAPRWLALAGAVALGAAMVAATHLTYNIAVDWIDGLESTVLSLYVDIDGQSPGRVVTVVLILIVATAEEALWRGVAIELLEPRLSRTWVAVVAVALYAVPQLIGGSWVLLAAAIVAGAVFTIQRLATGSLLVPIVTHAIWSACIFSLLPLA